MPHLSSFDDQPLYFEILGEKNQAQTELVLLHGLSGDSSALHGVAQCLLQQQPKTKIIIPDLRGHGYSSYVFPPNSTIWETFSQDLSELLTPLDLGNKGVPLFILGHSLGSLILQQASTLPAVNKVLSGAFIVSSTQTFFPRLSRIGKIAYPLLVHISQRWNFLLPRKRTWNDFLRYRHSHYFSIRRIFQDIYHTYPQKHALIFLAMMGWHNPMKPIVTCPSVCIHGIKDHFFSCTRQEKGVKVHTPFYRYAGGHNVIVDCYDEIATAVAQHLSQRS